MNKKILFTFILLAVFFFSAMIDITDDNSSVVSYLNNGGTISEPQTFPFNSNELDNPVWTQGMNMPAPTRYHGSGVGYSRNDTNWLICFGGDEDGSGHNSSVVSIYNATTNSWSTGAPCPPTLVFYCTASRLGNVAYIIGGIGPGGAFTSEVNEVKRYDIAANTWLTNAANYPITVASGGQGSASYQDSLIYVIGGMGNGTSNSVNDVNVYNSNSNTWRSCMALPTPVWGGACTISGDTLVYVCGAPTYGGAGTNTVYRGVISQADRSVITWNSNGQVYPGPSRIRMQGANWGCKGLIVGLGASSGFNYQYDVQVYSPGTNIWSAQPNCPIGRAAPFFASVRNENIWKLLVASGLRLGGPPYSNPYTHILTDTLCAPVPPVQLNLCRHVNKPLPSLSTARDTISILGNTLCSITDVNIKVDTVFHTWDADLAFSITQGSTTVPLITNRGGYGDNFIGTMLNDSAANPISSGTAPFTGSYRPEQPLNIFNGQSPEGLWIIRIANTGSDPGGILRSWCLIVSFTCPTGGIQTIEVPFAYRLSQNYPNPFNPVTTIKYGLPKPGNTKLVVYDVLGRIIATLVNEFNDAGTYNVSFDGTNLASGVYFYSLESGSYKETKKMLLVK